MDQYIDIVFDGPPGATSGRFVEVENERGESINVGSWVQRGEDKGYWVLRIQQEPTLTSIAEMIHNISTSKGFSQPSMDNLPQKLMLSVSELAEAMEEHRKERGLVWYGEDGKPEGILPELADSIIRNLHMMHSLIEESRREQEAKGDDWFEWTVGGVIREKVEFNAGRPLMHGGNIY